MAPLQSAVTSTSVVNGSQLESGGIISQGTGANIAAVTTTAWAWERRKTSIHEKQAKPNPLIHVSDDVLDILLTRIYTFHLTLVLRISRQYPLFADFKIHKGVTCAN